MIESLRDKRYKIIEEIHRGAQGCIYKAFDTKLDKHVAVKEMIDNFRNDDDKAYAVKRFREEAQLLFTLDHPGLSAVTDFFREEGKYYLVMDLVDGIDLQTYMENREYKPISPEKAEGWARQTLEILHYLHSFDPPIIYRDIKPSNLMIDRQDRIYMVDFGIARIFKPQKRGTTIGTPGFAPPEQYKGFTEPRSDLFSLGATLHYLLTGIDPADPSHPPFKFDDIKKYNPEIPDLFNKIISWTLQFSPENRPESAIQILRILNGDEPFPEIKDKKIIARITEVQPPPPKKAAGSFKYIAIISGVLILLLLFIGIALTKKSGSKKPTPNVTPDTREKEESKSISFNTPETPKDVPGYILPGRRMEWSFVIRVAVSPDGKLIAVGHNNGNIRIWNFKEKKVVKLLKKHKDFITCLSFSRDGKYLASGSKDKTALVWNISTGKPIFKVQNDSEIQHVELSPDNKNILMTDSKGIFRKISLKKKLLMKERARYFCLSPDGRKLALKTFGDGFNMYYSGTEHIAGYRFDNVSQISGMCFSPDGKNVAMATRGRIKIADLDSHTISKTLNSQAIVIFEPNYSPDGKYIAGCFADETAAIWDLSTGKIAMRIRTESFYDTSIACSVRNIVYTTDGKYLIFNDGYNVRIMNNPFYNR
ncbi:MAG: protein kinase [Candidatus Eremiobacteraeota bacterium]|nr:protein kinase [Candidatus Eremiobacteraeota bacterium]